jgi:hypothetical protein
MRNMKKMKQLLFKITILGLLTTLIASCGGDKTTSANSDKITFPTVEFTISATSDTTVFGLQGTRLFIEKGTFQFADGTPVTDTIKIKVKEFYRKSDITLADLSTESEGKLLETGGMLNITATSKGQELEIKGDKRIVIHFPRTQGSFKQMNLFYADKAASDSSVTNWNIDTISLLKHTMTISRWGWRCLIPGNDCTPVDSRPKTKIDSNKYFSLLQPYVDRFNFTDKTINEINNSSTRSVEFEVDISSTGKIENPLIKTTLSGPTEAEIIKFILSIPELTPSKDRHGNTVKRRGYLSLNNSKKISIYTTNEQYINSFNIKYAKFEKTPINTIDDAELEYYIFSLAKLGWINCDRFLESEKTVDYFVQIPTDKNTKIKMVFKDINGILMATSTDEKFVFSKVPIGSQVTIVAIKNTNGQFQTAFQEVTISDKPLETLAFKETTLTELKQQLEKLN